MGVDKALLKVGGVPMIEIAVEKLRSFCAEVSIAGNRNDLTRYGEVVHETRVGAGPGAGIEAGLRAARQPWVMFVPVDVPLVPAELLRRWCEEALRENVTVSFLGIRGKQPAFCLLRRERSVLFSRVLDGGERRLEVLLHETAGADGSLRMFDECDLYGRSEYRGPNEQMLERWFLNVNTPEDLLEAERALVESGR